MLHFFTFHVFRCTLAARSQKMCPVNMVNRLSTVRCEIFDPLFTTGPIADGAALSCEAVIIKSDRLYSNSNCQVDDSNRLTATEVSEKDELPYGCGICAQFFVQPEEAISCFYCHRWRQITKKPHKLRCSVSNASFRTK